MQSGIRHLLCLSAAALLLTGCTAGAADPDARFLARCGTAPATETTAATTAVEEVYTFAKCDPALLPQSRHKLRAVSTSYDVLSLPRFLGQVQTRFGEADYATDDYEDLVSYAVSATAASGAVRYLEVYSGPSGPSIGGEDEALDQSAADALAAYICAAKPSDCAFTCVYADIPLSIRMGVRDGVPYYEDDFSASPDEDYQPTDEELEWFVGEFF